VLLSKEVVLSLRKVKTQEIDTEAEEMSFLINYPSLIFCLFPVLCAHLVASYLRKRHWSEIWLAMGIPLGLLGSVVGATTMTNLVDFNRIYPASAIMLLTVLYGGIISMLGYFARQEQGQSSVSAISTVQLVILLAVFWSLYAWVISIGSEFNIYLSIEVAAIHLFVIGVSLFLSAKPNYIDTICEAALISASICVVIGVIALYSGKIERDAAILISMNGLTYGLLIYISTYFFSLKYPIGVEVSFSRLNWHWMEIVTFLIFMYFSTETIREYLQNNLAG
jgi:hypothetical protein